MPCENIVITIQETNEIVEIIVNDFSISNILSNDAGNSAVLGTDGGIFVETPTVGAQNHSELNLDDGNNPHGTTKSDVGLGNVDNTSDLLKPISNDTQTALNGKANTVHSHVISDVTGLQTELNDKLSKNSADYTAATLPLTGTEVAILNDGTNWVKITWNNIKAQLKSYFDTIYAPIGGGGGSTDYISYFSPRVFIDFPTVNDWQCSNNGFANSQFLGGTMISCGTSTTPSSTLALQAVPLLIPPGYIVDEILVNLNYKAFNTTASTLQFFIQREETNGTVQISSGSNPITISNDTLVTTTGTTANLRRIESLTINAHSLPSLAFSYLQIAIRETQNASYNALQLEIKFKKV